MVHTTYQQFTKLYLSEALENVQHNHQTTNNALQQVVRTFNRLDIPEERPLPFPEQLV